MGELVRSHSGSRANGRPFGTVVLPWAALAAMVLVGVAAAYFGFDILVLASLAVLGYLMLVRPYLGFLAVAATIPLVYVLTAGEGVTGTRLLGTVVAVAWLAGKLLRRESFGRLVSTHFFWVASVFLGLVLVSSLWSAVPRVAYVGFVQLARLLVLSILAVDLLNSEARVHWLLRVLVLSALTAGVLTIQQYLVGGVSRAGQGIVGTNNVVLVTLLPLAFFMLLHEDRWIWRAFGGLYLPITIAAISMTFSRMNFLLLPLVLLAMVWPTVRTRRGRRSLIGSVVGIAIVAAVFIPWDRVQQRAETIIPYLSSAFESGTRDSPVGDRVYHLEVAVAIFKDHPVLGVGYNHYGYYFINEYQYRVPGSPVRSKGQVYGTWRSPHSSHFGILADLGVVGMVSWGVMLGFLSWGLILAARHVDPKRDRRLWYLLFAISVSFALLAIPYGFWGEVQKSKLFWLVIGLTIVMRRLSEFERTSVVGGEVTQHVTGFHGPRV